MKPGDSKVLDTEIRGRNGFQSTPGYEAGRFVITTSSIFGVKKFQSTPGYEAGRFITVALIRASIPVSIHARL